MPRYDNIFDALNATYWAITPDKFDQISGFVNGLSSKEKLDFAFDAEKQFGGFGSDDEESSILSRVGVKVKNGTATFPIKGTMMKRMNMMMSVSGGASTEMMTQAVNAIGADATIKRVAFIVDSPGGSVEGLSALRDAIRALPQATVSIADDTMASAAYFVGSSADKVYATPDARVGSIGVITSRWDYSAAMDGAGVKQHIWRSGPYKALGYTSEPLSTDESKETQRTLDSYFQNFVQVVAENRFNGNLEQAEAVSDGRIYVGAEAASNNLVDGIKTVDELMAELDAEASFEEKYTALAAEHTKGIEAADAVKTENEALKAQIKAHEDAAIDQARATAQERAEQFVATLVEQGKVTAGVDHSGLVANLTKNFDGYSAVFDLVPTGSAGPGTFSASTANPADALEAKIAEAKQNGVPVAYSADEAKVFMDFKRTEGTTDASKHFVKGYHE